MTNPYIVENTVTDEKIYKSMPVDEKVFRKDTLMISETNTEGIISETNRQSGERYFRSVHLWKCLSKHSR